MTRRYFSPDLMSTLPIVTLRDDEAAHAIRVMRLSVNDPVELFDGNGNQAAAKVISVDRRQCICQCEPPQRLDREPSLKLELSTAFPKPERAKEMIERLTEMGVHHVQPLVFERTQRPPTDSLLVKLERVVIEACKQSGRNQLMTIGPVMPFGSWITTPSAIPTFVAMPGGETFRSFAPSEGFEDSLRWVIGPEGGLSEGELAACQHASMMAVDLGKRILRIETAACLVAARFLWD